MYSGLCQRKARVSQHKPLLIHTQQQIFGSFISVNHRDSSESHSSRWDEWAVLLVLLESNSYV